MKIGLVMVVLGEDGVRKRYNVLPGQMVEPRRGPPYKSWHGEPTVGITKPFPPQEIGEAVAQLLADASDIEGLVGRTHFEVVPLPG